jgi:pseudouridine-5'-phosphate glycosidase
MIVAVTAVRVVQMAIHQIIDVIAMRHGFVATTRAMNVAKVMGSAIVLRGAVGGVDRGQAYGVFIDVSLMQVVQMTVVKIVDVIVVLDGGMTAAFLMLMRMFRVSDTS